MNKNQSRALLSAAAIAVGVLAAIGQRPHRVEAQVSPPPSVIDFFTVDAIARNRAQLPGRCDDISMLSVMVPQRSGGSIPGIVVLCERR